MFGSDFTRFNKEEEKEEKEKPKQKPDELPVNYYSYSAKENTKSERKKGNFTVKTLVYFTEDDFMNKFVNQFSYMGIFSKINSDSHEPRSVIGTYQDTKISISLRMANYVPTQVFNEEMFDESTLAIMIYFDTSDEFFILKITNLINKIKSFTDAKFIVVLDKNDLNPEFDAKIKKLQDENLIQGIYQFSLDETNNNDRLVENIAKITKFSEKFDY